MNPFTPRVVHWETAGKAYFRILNGPPESVSMHAGLVRLPPGKSVGMHSTEHYEELVIVLEGQGEAHITGHEPFVIRGGDAVYFPPDTEHNLVNTGTGLFRYVYVVAKAEH